MIGQGDNPKGLDGDLKSNHSRGEKKTKTLTPKRVLSKINILWLNLTLSQKILIFKRNWSPTLTVGPGAAGPVPLETGQAPAKKSFVLALSRGEAGMAIGVLVTGDLGASTLGSLTWSC